jgi:Cu/Ag efflux protein CusF
MKRVLASCVVLAVCFATAGLAQDSQKSTDTSSSMSGKMMTGTVTKVDSSAKMMTVKDDSGKEWTVYWDESTTVSGTPSEGATVSFSATQKDGKTMAKSISVKPKA